MNDLFMPFLPGVKSPDKIPLERYIPPMPSGIFQTWLTKKISPGGLILDPFGSTPFLALEAAEAGYRVVVVCNNPILQFMLETLSLAPQATDFQAALADLAKERRNDNRLETHLKSLYQTDCISCRNMVPAQAFLWRRGDALPYARQFKCPICMEEGEYPISQTDLKRLSNLGSDALHRARAMQRVSLSELSKTVVDEALQTYIQRPLYFLFTLINRIESLSTSDYHRRLLIALLLQALDEGNALWPIPVTRNRPRQLTTPPHFRENNLWFTLEESIKLWSYQKTNIELTQWPDLPAEGGGICLYRK